MDLRVELKAAKLRIAELEREISMYRSRSRCTSAATSACAVDTPDITLPNVSDPPASSDVPDPEHGPTKSAPGSPSATSAQENLQHWVANSSRATGGSSSGKPSRSSLTNSRRNTPKSQIRTRSASSLKTQDSSDDHEFIPRKKVKREDLQIKNPGPNASSTDTSIHENAIELSDKTGRRRPPPLPLITKATSKKERPVIVAKCTEPLPGQTRYWTEEEHERFLEAVAEYGEKAYVAISNYVETRTPKQVRTHAQKFQMKMARLAKQSFEAGQPIQLPQGMLPIYPKLESAPEQDLHDMSKAISESKLDRAEKRRENESEKARNDDMQSDRVERTTVDMSDMLAEAASTVTDVSTPPLADPYLSYIGADTENAHNTELEDTFAAKLSNTLKNPQAELCVNKQHCVLSEAKIIDSSSIDTGGDNDDDLEDLEECGDLPIASLTNFGM